MRHATIVFVSLLTTVAAPDAYAQRYFARENLTGLARSVATPTPPPTPTPTPTPARTTCNAFQQNYLPPSNAQYLRAAVGSTLAARQADAKAACEAAKATVCAYNDSSPAQGGGYTIYIDTARPGTIRAAQGDVYWAAVCS
jgi:hypothetical protein